MNGPTYYNFLVPGSSVTHEPSGKGASSKNPLQRGSHLRPWDRMTNFTIQIETVPGSDKQTRLGATASGTEAGIE